jgi:hypothetical protein
VISARTLKRLCNNSFLSWAALMSTAAKLLLLGPDTKRQSTNSSHFGHTMPDPCHRKKVQIFSAAGNRGVAYASDRAVATIIPDYGYRSLNKLSNEGLALTPPSDLATAASAVLTYWRVCLFRVVHGFSHGRIAFPPFPHGHLTVGLNLLRRPLPFSRLGRGSVLDLRGWGPRD